MKRISNNSKRSLANQLAHAIDRRKQTRGNYFGKSGIPFAAVPGEYQSRMVAKAVRTNKMDSTRMAHLVRKSAAIDRATKIVSRRDRIARNSKKG